MTLRQHDRGETRTPFPWAATVAVAFLTSADLALTLTEGSAWTAVVGLMIRLPLYALAVGLLWAWRRAEVDRDEVVDEAVSGLQQTNQDVLQLLTAVIEAKDRYTLRHCEGVSRWASALAQRLGFDPQGVERVRWAGFLHDVGKVGLADEILRKAGPLTLEEYRACQDHPEVGHRIIRRAAGLADVADMVLYHQERFDGAGYPRGLSGDVIPLGARILAIADAYDAMRTHRPYRQALTPDRAKAELVKGRGSQFDPELVDQFMEVIDERRAVYDIFSEMGAD